MSEHGEELSANVCRLDGETGKWEVETELPAQRSHHCLAVLGGFIFAAGGSSSRDNGGDAACNLLYRYDPRHNQWTRVLYQRATYIHLRIHKTLKMWNYIQFPQKWQNMQ